MEITIPEMVRKIKEVDKANDNLLHDEFYVGLSIPTIINIYDEYYGLDEVSNIKLEVK